MKRIPELDAIRGIAAISVVLYHAFPYTFFLGWGGVELFFVLSGYLITTIVIREHRQPDFLKKFYLRRLSRIWPVYYLTLFTLLVLNRLSTRGYTTTGLWERLVFLQNTGQYLGKPPTPFIASFGLSWTVAIEEQYYLIWPLLVLCLGRRAIVPLCLALLSSTMVGRLVWPGVYNVLLTRGDGLAFGCLLACLLVSKDDPVVAPRLRRLAIASAVVGLSYLIAYAIAFFRDPGQHWTTTCFSAVSLLASAIIALCVLDTGRPYLVVLRNPILRWLGTVSYAMYLFHRSILYYTAPLLDRAGIHSHGFQLAATWILIIALPAASWYGMERPILRMKERKTARNRALAGSAAC